ncbi:hypothetical protein HCX48_04770 [Rhodocyclus tenuis]|uniref:Uncharacterized protein n=1 Tax=Rhodocyclus gracilis TaxID=2929842 RepID=A0ABX0WG78_9RHOO|nr:PhaM family polyhydroxyalkanoate granule multifunctional regulatory protein [Rhodocyclus gracilis]NJA88539.1 hypothetical protein [Rhodocyclus gracilis]
MATDTAGEPGDLLKKLWENMGLGILPGIPGSIPEGLPPSMDLNDLQKRIADLKAVEGWLKMNLSMLQASIQGMELQWATINALRAMGGAAANTSPPAPGTASAAASNAPADAAAGADPHSPFSAQSPLSPLSQAAMWPWQLLQQMQQMQSALTPSADTPATGASSKDGKAPDTSQG